MSETIQLSTTVDQALSPAKIQELIAPGLTPEPDHPTSVQMPNAYLRSDTMVHEPLIANQSMACIEMQGSGGWDTHNENETYLRMWREVTGRARLQQSSMPCSKQVKTKALWTKSKNDNLTKWLTYLRRDLLKLHIQKVALPASPKSGQIGVVHKAIDRKHLLEDPHSKSTPATGCQIAKCERGLTRFRSLLKRGRSVLESTYHHSLEPTLFEEAFQQLRAPHAATPGKQLSSKLVNITLAFVYVTCMLT